MKFLMAFLLELYCYSVSAQVKFQELKSMISSYQTVQEFDNLLRGKTSEDLDAFLVYYEFKRPVDNGYQQNRINIDSYIKINFISKNGKLKFGWVSKFDDYNEKINDSEEIKPAEDEIKAYLKVHNSLYNSTLAEEDLKDQILTEYIVGFGCGYSGSYTSEESSKMKKYVRQKDVDRLNNWLTSFSPELQTLGAIGLIKIGVLNDRQKLLIERLKKRNTAIYNCMGCMYSYDFTFKKLVEIYSE